MSTQIAAVGLTRSARRGRLRFKTVAQSKAQPARKAIPPKGVTAPIPDRPVSPRRYRLPEKMCVVATYFITPALVAGLASIFTDRDNAAESIRKLSAAVFIVSSTFLGFITFGYLAEFGDQFNHFVFGLFYDDLSAILITIWKHYHPVPNAIGMALVIGAGLWLFSRMERRGLPMESFLRKLTASRAGRIVFALGVLILFAVGIRGSIGRRPVQLKDAGITRDDFLNKTILNPQMALVYALQQHIRLSRSKGIEFYLPDGNIAAAAQFVTGKPGGADDLDAYFARTAKGPKGKAPRHIFLIVAESYSTWPLRDKYAPLGLAEGLKQLAGQALRRAFPAGPDRDHVLIVRRHHRNSRPGGARQLPEDITDALPLEPSRRFRAPRVPHALFLRRISELAENRRLLPGSGFRGDLRRGGHGPVGHLQRVGRRRRVLVRFRVEDGGRWGPELQSHSHHELPPALRHRRPPKGIPPGPDPGAPEAGMRGECRSQHAGPLLVHGPVHRRFRQNGRKPPGRPLWWRSPATMPAVTRLR